MIDERERTRRGRRLDRLENPEPGDRDGQYRIRQHRDGRTRSTLAFDEEVTVP